LWKCGNISGGKCVDKCNVDNSPQTIALKPSFFNRLSTGKILARELFQEFSTRSTLHKKKSDKIYKIKYNNAFTPRRIPA